MIRQMLMALLILPLAACNVGPDYKHPLTITPVKFKEARGKGAKKVIVKNNVRWKLAEPNDGFDRGKWWEIFNEPELNKLEERLNISNQTIASAYENYQQARAMVDEARASYYPTLSGTTSIFRQKNGQGTSSGISTSGVTSTGSTSGAISSISGNGSTAAPTILSTHSLIFTPSWTVDLWGLVRRQVEASAAGAQASAALLAQTRLVAQGSLAQYYFELRGLDADQKFLDDTVKAYKKSWQLTKNQYDSGVASESDVLQALSLLQTAQAAAINNGVNRAIYEHAIAVLLGTPPANFSMPVRILHKTPPAIPLMIPCELLERRPDVAQAERLMAQANAQIGVAVAAYYPTFTLTGNVNDAGQGGLSRLISMPAVGWSYGYIISQLILDGGLREATVAAAQSGYMATVATYRQTVLAAFQNVEDNLATLRILRDEAIVLNAAADTAKQALKLVQNQYMAGTVSYSSVLLAEIQAFTAEKSALDIAALRMVSAAALVVSLGGGWEARSIAPAAG